MPVSAANDGGDELRIQVLNEFASFCATVVLPPALRLRLFTRLFTSFTPRPMALLDRFAGAIEPARSGVPKPLRSAVAKMSRLLPLIGLPPTTLMLTPLASE